MMLYTYLNAECRIILFKDEIPDIQSSIHPGGVKDGRSGRAPAPIGKVCHMVLSPHDGAFPNVF